MSDEAAFLAAIRAEPDEDGPRLRYADWLEENGDPDRSAFIRLQCAAARLPADDPDTDALVLRAGELLNRNWIEWLTPVCEALGERAPQPKRPPPASWLGRLFRRFETERWPGWPFHLSRFWPWDPAVHMAGDLPGRLSLSMARFRRGLLEELEVIGPFAGAAARLERLAQIVPLLRLKCHVRGDARAWRQTDGPHCETLRDLHVYDDRDLGLSWRDRPSAFTRVVRDLVASPHLTRLESLALRHPGEETGTASSLARSPLLGRLRRLELTADLDAVRLLAREPSARGLASLNLTGNGLPNEAVRVLAESPHFAGLTELQLGGNAIDDTGIAELAGSRHLTRLTSLDLRANQFGPAGLEALAASPNFAGLVSLDLGGVHSPGEPSPIPVFGEAVATLAASPHLGRLRSLRLLGRAIGDAGLAALARSPQLSALEDLDVSQNQIGNAGVIALASAPESARLRRLNLLFNPIGEAGCSALARSPNLDNLRRLHVELAGVSEAGERALRERFGDRVTIRRQPTSAQAAADILRQFLNRPR